MPPSPVDEFGFETDPDFEAALCHAADAASSRLPPGTTTATCAAPTPTQLSTPKSSSSHLSPSGTVGLQRATDAPRLVSTSSSSTASQLPVERRAPRPLRGSVDEFGFETDPDFEAALCHAADAASSRLPPGTTTATCAAPTPTQLSTPKSSSSHLSPSGTVGLRRATDAPRLVSTSSTSTAPQLPVERRAPRPLRGSVDEFGFETDPDFEAALCHAADAASFRLPPGTTTANATSSRLPPGTITATSAAPTPTQLSSPKSSSSHLSPSGTVGLQRAKDAPRLVSTSSTSTAPQLPVERRTPRPPEGQGHVYVLELQDGCFYVGFSRDVSARIEAHRRGEAAAWTRQHAVVRVVDISVGTERREMDLTIALMLEHGWQKVRGGPWCQPELVTEPPEVTAKRIVRNSLSTADLNRCHYCQQVGHFASSCAARQASSSAGLREQPRFTAGVPACKEKSFPEPRLQQLSPSAPRTASRPAGEQSTRRTLHSSPTQTVAGQIDGKESATAQFVHCHSRRRSGGGTIVNSKSKRSRLQQWPQSSSSGGQCFRCGELGHWARDCELSTDSGSDNSYDDIDNDVDSDSSSDS